MKNGNYAAVIYLLASLVWLTNGLVSGMVISYIISALFLIITVVFWKLPKPFYIVKEYEEAEMPPA